MVLPFSYTDLQSQKRRPALMLLDSNDGDILVARVTSKKIDSQYDVAIQNWDEIGLLVPSFVRLHKLITIEKTHVIKNLGKVSNTDQQILKNVFNTLI